MSRRGSREIFTGAKNQESRFRREKAIENRLGLMASWRLKTEVRSRKTGVKVSFRNEVRNLSGVGIQKSGVRSLKSSVKMSFRNEVKNLSGVGSQAAVGS